MSKKNQIHRTIGIVLSLLFIAACIYICFKISTYAAFICIAIFVCGGFVVPFAIYFASNKINNKFLSLLVKFILLIPLIIVGIYFVKLKVLSDGNYIIPDTTGMYYSVETKLQNNEEYRYSIRIKNEEGDFERINSNNLYYAEYGDTIDIKIRISCDDNEETPSKEKSLSFPVYQIFGDKQSDFRTFSIYTTDDEYTEKVIIIIHHEIPFWDVITNSLDYSDIDFTVPKDTSSKKEKASTASKKASKSKSKAAASPTPKPKRTPLPITPEVYDYENTPMHSVNSTAISELGYSYEDNVLLIRFKDSGSLYIYYDVPKYEYEQLDDASSIGGYYNQNIKGIYDCERLE